MKKFKHTITGEVVRQSEHNQSLYYNVVGGSIQACYLTEKYGWEEIVEIKPPIYKILSFMHVGTHNIWKLDETNNTYYNTSSNIKSLMEKAFYTKYFDITSVQKLSDGVIFKVNDILELAYGAHKIKSIKLINNQIVFYCYPQASCTGWSKTCNCTVLIQNAKKSQIVEKLFTTEDGKDIYKGDDYYLVRKDLLTCNLVKAMLGQPHPVNCLAFSTKELGDKWLEDNKILFTTEDRIPIRKGDKYYWIATKGDVEVYEIAGPTTSNEREQIEFDKKFGVKNFASKDKAQEYILYNKPCLSLNDVASVYVTANRKAQPMTVHGKRVMKMGKQPEALLNLVKEKLKI